MAARATTAPVVLSGEILGDAVTQLDPAARTALLQLQRAVNGAKDPAFVRTFRRFNFHRPGEPKRRVQVSLSEFRSAVKGLGIIVPYTHLQAIFHAFGTAPTAPLDVMAFRAWLKQLPDISKLPVTRPRTVGGGGRRRRNHHHRSRHRRAAAGQDDLHQQQNRQQHQDTQAPSALIPTHVVQLAQRLVSQLPGKNPDMLVGKLRHLMRGRAHARVSYQDFVQALIELGCDLNQNDMHVLFTHIDVNSSGGQVKLPYLQEWFAAVRPTAGGGSGGTQDKAAQLAHKIATQAAQEQKQQEAETDAPATTAVSPVAPQPPAAGTRSAMSTGASAEDAFTMDAGEMGADEPPSLHPADGGPLDGELQQPSTHSMPDTAAAATVVQYVGGVTEFLHCFSHIRSDISAQIGMEEFKACLLEAGLGLSDTEMTCLFQALDVSGIGTLDLEALAAEVLPPGVERPTHPAASRVTSPELRAAVHVEEELRRAVKKNFHMLSEAFRTAGATNGRVSPEQFKQVMDRFCLVLSYHDLRHILGGLHNTADGKVSVAEFLRKYDPSSRKHPLGGELSRYGAVPTPRKHRFRQSRTISPSAIRMSTSGDGADNNSNNNPENGKGESTFLPLATVATSTNDANAGGVGAAGSPNSRYRGGRSDPSALSPRKANDAQDQLPGITDITPRGTVLQDRVLRCWQALQRAYQMMDERGRGYVAAEDFLRTLVTFRILDSASCPAAKKLQVQFTDSNGHVDYRHFLRRLVVPPDQAVPERCPSRGSSAMSTGDDQYTIPTISDEPAKAYGAHRGRPSRNANEPLGGMSREAWAICCKYSRLVAPRWREIRGEMKAMEEPVYPGAISPRAFAHVLMRYGIVVSKADLQVLASTRPYQCPVPRPGTPLGLEMWGSNLRNHEPGPSGHRPNTAFGSPPKPPANYIAHEMFFRGVVTAHQRMGMASAAGQQRQRSPAPAATVAGGK